MPRGPTQTPAATSEDMQSLLSTLIEQARALASRMGGDADRENPCHFCGSGVPLWESLMVMQLAGVPAHIECPEDKLRAKLLESAPVKEFPYEDFSSAVDARLGIDRPVMLSGIIEYEFHVSQS